MHELIHDLALSIVMAWLLGVAANFIRQPLILAYLVAGFVIGPFGFKWIQSEQSINTIAELGLIEPSALRQPTRTPVAGL